MTQESSIERQEEQLSPHIFSVSAGMIGVCLTVIGLLNVTNAIKQVNTIADDLTALGSVLFSLSCCLSYMAMKTKERTRRLSVEKAADRVFLLGLSLMVVICLLVVYSFSAAGALSG